MINSAVIQYDDIDKEIRNLCKLINKFDGIQTCESCFGHYERPCLIWFKCTSIEKLNSFLHYCFNHEGRWQVHCHLSDPVKNSNILEMIIYHDTKDIVKEIERLENRIINAQMEILIQ